MNPYKSIQTQSVHGHPSRIYTQMESNQWMSRTNEEEISTNSKIKVKASQIRSAQLTNVNGESITLGEAIGDGTSLVIFLRHMG